MYSIDWHLPIYLNPVCLAGQRLGLAILNFDIMNILGAAKPMDVSTLNLFSLPPD